MTNYRIRLYDASTIDVSADELTTRSDGSLWVMVTVETPERRRSALPLLRPVLVLARGDWVRVWAADQPNPFAPQDEPASAESARAPSALVQMTPAEADQARRQAVAQRIAALDQT
ncbi:hypothetical protein [Mycobacterium sp. M23085]|uniref:hypothetical protein n=1 Tax=Mycobacterium sp. M23085 TaxID=3378087 RepID=UPI003877F3C5